MIVGDKVVHEIKDNDKEKLNLLLDLDSTIIYSKKYKKNTICDFTDDLCVTLLCEHETTEHIYQIHARNNFSDFLNDLCKHFNIYIYTMATFDYAFSICKSIEHHLKKKPFSGIVARHGNFEGQSKYFYNLKYLNENNTIIIDDNKDIWIDDHKKNLIKINQFKYTSLDNHTKDKSLEIIKELVISFIKEIKDGNLYETIKTINTCYQISV